MCGDATSVPATTGLMLVAPPIAPPDAARAAAVVSPVVPASRAQAAMTSAKKDAREAATRDERTTVSMLLGRGEVQRSGQLTVSEEGPPEESRARREPARGRPAASRNVAQSHFATP